MEILCIVQSTLNSCSHQFKSDVLLFYQYWKATASGICLSVFSFLSAIDRSDVLPLAYAFSQKCMNSDKNVARPDYRITGERNWIS